MKDRLFNLIEQSFERCKSTPHCSKCNYTGTGGNCFKYLMADHILGNGVIVLPCKIGDTVYQTDGARIYESTIYEITLTSNKTIFVTENIAFDETAIGKGIFLTREEAEAKMKGGAE